MSLLAAVDAYEFTEVDYTGASFEEVVASLESLVTVYESVSNKSDSSKVFRMIFVAFRKLVDIVLSSMVRTGVKLKGILKSIDETSLQTTINNNRLAYRGLTKADYNVIRKIEVATFPFRAKPSEVTELILSAIGQMKAVETIKQLAKPMREFTSAFLDNDMQGCSSSIANINAITMPEAVTTIKKDMVSIVQKQLHSTHERFGNRYSSLTMFDGIVKEVMTSSDAINDTTIVIKESEKIAKLTDNVLKLSNRAQGKSSIKTLMEMAKSIRNIAEFIDGFAVTVQEYHHLEHNMTNVLKGILLK